jgi:hypothetical protein
MYGDAFPILEDVDWLLLLLMYSNFISSEYIGSISAKPAMEMC